VRCRAALHAGFVNRETRGELGYLLADSLLCLRIANLDRISAIQPPICSISGSRIPREVMEDSPSDPAALHGGKGSKGMAFLFTVIPARSRAFSASFP